MTIKGALFDCDGTLLDSMPMWTRCCVSLLKRYGVAEAERVFAEHESLDMDKKCYWYHDNLGIGQSGEALYRELWAMVSKAYEQEAHPYEGCREFLEELQALGVPCAIVSSTPTELVEQALRSHGLLKFFGHVCFVGDLGRSKEYSDCYVGAAKVLGTPRDKTWVFEDAPFGVRSAVRAGFPTVAILNDHDGRDETFLNTWATVVTRSFSELSASRLDKLEPRVTRALVVDGSPEPSSPTLVGRCAKESDVVIAADAGVEVLCAAQVVPHIYCGDQDSASPDGVDWARRGGAKIEVHPKEKDDTDLTLAIRAARRYADNRGSALRLTLTCASGGRPDHALSIWGVLAQNKDLSPRLVEDGFECRILSPSGESTWSLHAQNNAVVSLVALAPHTIASAKGMHWNLHSKEIGLLSDLGISNRVEDACATIACEAGVLAVFRYA